MKKLKYYIVILFAALFTSSCENYLNVLPENQQSSDDYWRTKEEVEAVVGAGYYKMRNAIQYMLLWGEARGNGVALVTDGTDEQKAAKKIRAFQILTDNALCKWGDMYSVIAMANSVLKYAPDVVERDASFNVNVMNSYCSEAYFQRALAYFYLVRTFRDVPYVTEPYVDDSAPYSIAKSDGESILKNCLADLERAAVSAKEYFPEVDNTNQINSKGRATKWAIYTLMADINLWLGNYQDCITYADKVILSGRVGLINGDIWFSNFYPGNSNESIFELQYSSALSQTNKFADWFKTTTGLPKYQISDYMMGLFSDITDIRGVGASYYEGSGFSSGILWKYVGKTNLDARDNNDANWIVYRLAEVYLMKAEAYAMLGGDENLRLGTEVMNKIRTRSKIDELPQASNTYSLITNILHERQREFFSEGKNWFDILRIGRRGGDYKSLLIEQVLESADGSNSSMIRSSLADEGSWYLPYHESEMTANTLLVQSDYYKILGN